MKYPTPDYQNEKIILVSETKLKRLGIKDFIKKSEQRTRYEDFAAKYPQQFDDSTIRLVIRAYRFGLSFDEIQAFFRKIGRPIENFAITLILQEHCPEFAIERWDRAKRRAALAEFLKERVKDERKACYKVRMKYAITSSELRMMLEDKGISYNEASFSRKKPQKF